MKIRVCDVCFFESKKLVRAEYKVGSGSNSGKNITIDACREHRDFLRGESLEGAQRKVLTLIGCVGGIQ